MDSFDRMREPLGTVPARHGANTVVGPSSYGTVMVAHFVQAGSLAIERDHTAHEARELADLLDQAAYLVNSPGNDSDERYDCGTVPVDGTDSAGPTGVAAGWPLVEVRALHVDGSLQLGLEYTPGRAAELARLLRKAADMLDE